MRKFMCRSCKAGRAFRVASFTWLLHYIRLHYIAFSLHGYSMYILKYSFILTNSRFAEINYFFLPFYFFYIYQFVVFFRNLVRFPSLKLQKPNSNLCLIKVVNQQTQSCVLKRFADICNGNFPEMNFREINFEQL